MLFLHFFVSLLNNTLVKFPEMNREKYLVWRKSLLWEFAGPKNLICIIGKYVLWPKVFPVVRKTFFTSKEGFPVCHPMYSVCQRFFWGARKCFLITPPNPLAQDRPYSLQPGGGMDDCDTGPTGTSHSYTLHRQC